MLNTFPKKFLIRFLIPLLAGLAIGTLLVPLFENRLIYHPFKYPDGFWHPDAYGITDCYFTTTDGIRLNGWFLPAKDARATLLIFHGNAGNISYYADYMKKLEALRFNVFIVDYRGYGRSEGEPDEEGLYRDAEGAYAYLRDIHRVDPQRLILFGISLGTCVAVDLATKVPCRGMILEAAPTSAKDVAKSLWLPFWFLLKSRFDSLTKIKALHVPVLFIHGADDQTIPIRLGKKLYDHANEPKQFYEIPGADHNNSYVVGGEQYFGAIDRFITGALSDKSLSQ